MTRADILTKYSRRSLADMVIELEHQLASSEERSFDYAARLVRSEATVEARAQSAEAPR
jgi:hypothetical protein